jgi:general secretion pathway protein I
MISVAILAGVILTVLTSVNHHLGVLARERSETSLSLLARSKMEELQLQTEVRDQQEGTFPDHPGITWQMKRGSVAVAPGVSVGQMKVVVSIEGKHEVTLVQYLEQ